MKKYLALLIVPILFFVASCTDSTTDAPVVSTKGSVVIQSTPVGAKIFLAGVDQGKVTPDTLKDLTEGSYQVTLKLAGYNDSTFTVTVTANSVINWTPVVLYTNTQLVTYGPVQIWETAGTDASQPSGLDLSSGAAYGISSTNNTDVDIYYTSNGFVVTSADNATGLTRKTYFKVGGASVLTDGVASSVKDNTWTDRMTDRETNYVYLYDADKHYTKIIIDSYGGGVPGFPAWVKVKWVYNKTVDDVRFK
ncbi:MAG: PEGA domain-containing protein [Ignavibacteriaceae bacterium]